MEMVASLTSQLDLAVEEAETEKAKAMEARRLLGQVQRSSQRFEKQVADLSKQVCFLLRELEVIRGNPMRDAPAEDDERVTSSEGSAGAIISRHLVTFRDVEELQQRNQMLIAALREVSDKQDAEEANAIEAKTAKIQQALETALAEVEHHRDTRKFELNIKRNVFFNFKHFCRCRSTSRRADGEHHSTARHLSLHHSGWSIKFHRVFGE